MKNKAGPLTLLGATVTLLATGCQTGVYTSRSPQSHFDFPNSNVTPLGPVKVEVSGPSNFLKPPDVVTSDSDQLVYTAALAQQPGANLLIDYTKIYKSYSFFPFTWSKLQLEGTACKMELGKQDINAK
jgi:hypothetical protein